MTRYTTYRSSINAHNKPAFEYPFRCLCKRGILKKDKSLDQSRYYHQIYKIEQIIKPIYTLPYYEPGDFPNNIKKWIWSSVYYPQWHLLCELDNGLYAYFNASCDETASFDNSEQSQMSLYISPDIQNIVLYAFTDNTYNRYIQETQPLYPLDNSFPKKMISMMENLSICSNNEPINALMENLSIQCTNEESVNSMC